MSFLVRLPEEHYPIDPLSKIGTCGFTLGNARAAAWISQLSYEDDLNKIQRVTKDWGVTRLTAFGAKTASILPLGATRGLVLETPAAVFVAFAGTDPLDVADWITDLDFLADPQGIHRGFSRALDLVWPDLSALIASTRTPIYVVGHSLGGALAVLCARQVLSVLPIRIEAVYTFGMPRAGGNIFARGLNDTIGAAIFRFVYGEDIVATVPPSNLGFRHVGRRISCERNAKFAASALRPDFDDDPPLRNLSLISLAGTLKLMRGQLHDAPGSRRDPVGRALRLLPPPIADHLPDRYCRAPDP